MDEIWKKIPITGYQDTYEISSIGRLRNYKRGRIVAQDSSDKRGYLRYALYNKGKKLRKGAHVLVAMAFHPNPNGKLTVNHENGNKSDNRVSNLSWATLSEQQLHAISTGLKVPEKKAVLQFSTKGVFIAKFDSIVNAVQSTGSSGTSISAVCKGKRKTHNGFRWEYSDEKDKKKNIIPKEIPSGVTLTGFSKYVFVRGENVVKIYSLFKNRFIPLRIGKKYKKYVLVDDNGVKRNRSYTSIQKQVVLCTKLSEKSGGGPS
jgi:hypothetical protein